MKVIYAGSFDPVTNGHLDIIKRAREIFGEVIVAVLDNTSKKGLFTVEERKALLHEVLDGMEGIEVDSFDGDTDLFVPPIVGEAMKKKLLRRKI